MTNLNEAEEEIKKLEDGKTCYQVRERLDALYIVRDHLAGKRPAPVEVKEVKPARRSPTNEYELDQSSATAWVESMENEDGSKAQHWSMEQTEPARNRRGMTCDALEFWVTINMLYLDYCSVAKKYGLGNKIDFYADMARVFLMDCDAESDKLERYYRYIAKK